MFESGFATEDIRKPRHRRVTGQLFDAGFVDYGFLGGQLRLRRDGIFLCGNYNAFWCVRCGVDEASGHGVDTLTAGAEDTVVHAEALQFVGVNVVRDFAGVRVKQNFVRIETVAVLIEVGDKTCVRTRGPRLVPRPVRAPRAEADERAELQPLQLAAPHTVLTTGEEEGVRRRGSQRLRVHLELNARGGWGEDSECHPVRVRMSAKRPGGG